MSNNTGNRHAPVVEVVYLTTKRKTTIPTHVYINSARRPSIALCEQIVTVCKSRLKEHIGSVTVAEMRKIDRALQTSLGIQKTGGENMQVTIKTPFGEMSFNMTQDKANDLMKKALDYATGQEEKKETPARPASVPQEPPKTIKPKDKPRSRVESLFGDFRGTSVAQEEKEEPAEPEEYRGFLLIKCQHCGKVKGFCSKTPMSKYTCECGKVTPLHGLKPAHLHCKCGSYWKYKTNITDETFDYNCLNCGNPVSMQLNNRRNTYVTIE